MRLYQTLLALTFALTNANTVNAQNNDLQVEASGYKKFLIYPHLKKGFEAMEQGHRDRAIAEFEQARTLAPNSVIITTYLAEVYRRFGQPSRAESVLKEQLAVYPENLQLKKILNDLLLQTKVVQKITPGEIQTSNSIAASTNTRKLVLIQPVRLASIPLPALRAQQKRSTVKNNKNKESQHITQVIPQLPTQQQGTNQAYLNADKAYISSALGQFAAALPLAREAVALAPENRSYRKLLVYLLAQNESFEEADKYAIQLLATSANNTNNDDTDLMVQHQTIRRQLAYVHFDASNKAASVGNLISAVEEARKGVVYAPSVLPHRMQLLHALLASGNITEANQVATIAIQDLPREPGLLVLRGYTHQRLGSNTLANSDFDKALELNIPNTFEIQNYRIIAAAAAMSSGDANRALAILKPLETSKDEAVTGIRKIAIAKLNRNISPTAIETFALPVPGVICVGFSFTPSCDIWPGETTIDLGYADAQAAYKAYNSKDHANSIRHATNAVKLSPQNASYRLLHVNAYAAADQWMQAEKIATEYLSRYGEEVELLALRSKIRKSQGLVDQARQDADSALKSERLSLVSEIALLLQLDRRLDARSSFLEAYLNGQLKDQPNVTVAYLAAQVGDNERAYAAFELAQTNGELPDTAWQDAAFTAGRLGHNGAALKFFKQALDASESGKLTLTQQQQFDIRREIADRSRNWGANSSVTYRGINPAASQNTKPGAANDSLQTSAELYWRPFEYNKGELLEIYSGVSATLSSKAGYPTGQESLQSTFGLRIKPLASTNLFFALERRNAIGSKATTDWLTRMSYSESWGTDLKPTVASWTTANIYAEAGRYIKQRQSYATFEGQAGRSFRLDSLHPKLVVFPHVVLGADYNSSFKQTSKTATGVGAGVNLRYWLNEDRYNAPRSYNDISLQYRARVSGDDRAKGAFLRFSMVY
jgi:bacteriophage N4 adsorption protein A